MPKTKKYLPVKIIVCLSEEQRDEVAKAADSMGMPVSTWIRTVIKREIEKPAEITVTENYIGVRRTAGRRVDTQA